MSKRTDSLDSWKSRKRHTITLPSGTSVAIEIPNLPLMAKVGKLPNNLIEKALQLQSARRISQEDLEGQVEFQSHMVAITVKDPALAAEEVAKLIEGDELPNEDVDMIVEFALRARDIDAVGHHIGGLETVESFRDLRGL